MFIVKYIPAWFLSYFYRLRPQQNDHELVFVLPGDAGTWILGAICREIAAHTTMKTHFHYQTSQIPKAKYYFFAHYSLYFSALKRNPALWSRKCFVFHTHPKDLGITDSEFAFVMNRSSKIIQMCSSFQPELEKRGVNAERLAVVVGGGADPKLFKSHVRRGRTVGFCTAFYERKNPDRIFDLIRSLQDYEFILIGRHWDKYARFNEMRSLSNFKYYEVEYAQYPALYAQMDVFVAPSELEGGPIPLLEAMMSNVMPVACITGFAPDIIVDGKNGYLFPSGSTADHIAGLIRKAVANETDVNDSIKYLDWEYFTKQIEGILTA